MRTIWTISFGCLCFREQYIWKWRMDHGRFCKNGRELLQGDVPLQADQISVTVPDGLTEDNLQKFRMLLMLVSVIVTASLPSTFATLRNTTIGTLLKQALINIWNLSKNEV